MSKIERFCIVCDKSVAAAMNDDCFTNPPNNATVWQSYGNYGTDLFDPMSSNEYLECFVCDECLKLKSQHVYHVRTKKKEVEYIFHSFKKQLDKENKAIEALKGKTP